MSNGSKITVNCSCFQPSALRPLMPQISKADFTCRMAWTSLLSSRCAFVWSRAGNIFLTAAAHVLCPFPLFPAPGCCRLESRSSAALAVRDSGSWAGTQAAASSVSSERPVRTESSLLLSCSCGSWVYHAIKLLPPLTDKPSRRRRARITRDQ